MTQPTQASVPITSMGQSNVFSHLKLLLEMDNIMLRCFSNGSQGWKLSIQHGAIGSSSNEAFASPMRSQRNVEQLSEASAEFECESKVGIVQ